MHGPMLCEVGWPDEKCIAMLAVLASVRLPVIVELPAPTPASLRGCCFCLQALLRKYMPVAVVIAILLFVFLIRRWLYT